MAWQHGYADATAHWDARVRQSWELTKVHVPRQKQAHCPLTTEARNHAALAPGRPSCSPWGWSRQWLSSTALLYPASALPLTRLRATSCLCLHSLNCMMQAMATMSHALLLTHTEQGKCQTLVTAQQLSTTQCTQGSLFTCPCPGQSSYYPPSSPAALLLSTLSSHFLPTFLLVSLGLHTWQCSVPITLCVKAPLLPH